MKKGIYRYIEDFDGLNDKDSGYSSNNKFYHLKDMLDEIKKSKPQLETLDINSMYHAVRRHNKNVIRLVNHIKRVEKADINIPIIINYDGDILDGYHRLAKHILEGKTKIKAYRINLENVKRTKED